METFEDFFKTNTFNYILVVVTISSNYISYILSYYTKYLVYQFQQLMKFLTALIDPIKGIQLANKYGVGPSSTFFKIAAFPGFTFAALMATLIILYERKLIAKVQLRGWSSLCRKI